MLMTRRMKRARRRTAPGASPGQVVPPHGAGRSDVTVTAFGPGECVELEGDGLETIDELLAQYPVVWVDVEQLGDADLITSIGKRFGLHSLALEDVVNTHQRPKVEDYENHVFIIAHMLAREKAVHHEQVAFFVGKGYVITFRESANPCFLPVRNRLRKGKSQIRIRDAGFLCYTLLDSIVDYYFPELETVGEALETIEEKILSDPKPSHIAELHDLKRELLILRRSVWPHREMINHLVRDESEIFSGETRLFLRDTYDHTIQLMDFIETYREIVTGLVDVYISSNSTRLNEIMKVLTVISTIFLPMTFITGLYGMNFDRGVSPWNMPELGWWLGYPYALGLMALSTLGMLWYFKRKKWLFDGRWSQSSASDEQHHTQE